MRILSSILFFCVLIFTTINIFAANPPPVKKAIYEYQLNNGLQLIVKPDTRAPVVLSEIWYRVGSSYEHAGITGISHFLEHMMFKGTTKYPADTFIKLIADNGGQQNAMTTQDFTVYYQELSNDKLPLAFKLEADRMQHLVLSQKDFTSELEVVQEERKMRVDNDPIMLTYERYNAAAFLNNPYRNPVAGWASDLQQFTLDDLKQWYSTWYVPNNATIVVIGDVQPEAVYKLAQENFGAIKPKPLPEIKKYPLTNAIGQKTVFVKAPAKLPMLYLGFNVPSAVTAHESYEPYALDVLATVLGGTNSSRLQKDLVRDKRMAGDIAVYYSIYARLPTLFQVAAIPAEGIDTQRLQAEIINEIIQLQDKPISENELKRIKTQVIANRIYARDSIDSQGMIIGTLASVGLAYTEIDNYQQQIEKITPTQIQAVAKKYLNAENLTVGILLPQTITAPLKKTQAETTPALRNTNVQ